MTPPVGPAFSAGRRALVAGFLGAMLALLLVPAAEAQTPDYTFTVKPVGGKDAWAINTLQFPAGSKLQLIYNSTGSVLPHDIQVYRADGTTLIVGTNTSIDTDSPPVATPIFTMPADGAKYVCSIHPTTMIGTIKAGPFELASTEAPSITHAGVHYLAYWIGIISFAAVFVVYGASFFLFKHGETPATTDQKDRPDWEGKQILGTSEIVWVVVALGVLSTGVVIFFRIMLSGF